MNMDQAKIVLFWLAIIAAAVVLDDPDPNRILFFGVAGICWAWHQYLLVPLYPEDMKIPRGRGLMAWIDKNPAMKAAVPIYYFGLILFSVASWFLLGGKLSNYIDTAPRLFLVLFFPFILYFVKTHYDLFRLLGQRAGDTMAGQK